MNRFAGCDICGSMGHKAKHCGLNRLEEQRDPLGELVRKEGYKERERQRQIKRQNALNIGSPQTSRGFGL